MNKVSYYVVVGDNYVEDISVDDVELVNYASHAHRFESYDQARAVADFSKSFFTDKYTVNVIKETVVTERMG